MADDKIKLSIELEEGSVKKSFDNIGREAKKASKDISSSFSSASESSASSLSGIATTLGGVTAAVIASAYTIKKSFESALDFALLGEKVQSIETQFNNIAQSAGVAAESLKDGLLASSKGLLDDDELLQRATRSIVALGESAKQLPSIFDQSRIASKNLGTDFKETSDAFTTFVETGNARTLKQFGIVLDTTKAVENYAKSIGLAANQLNQTQLQQIRINELLETSSKRFKDTGESTTQLKDSLTRLSVVFNNFIDDAAVKFSNSFGPSISRITDSLANFIKTASLMDYVKEGFLSAVFGVSYFAKKIDDAAKIADDFSNASLKEMLEISKKASENIQELGNKAAYLRSELSNIGKLDLSKIGEKFRLESQLKSVNEELVKAQANYKNLYDAIAKRQDSKVTGGDVGSEPVSISGPDQEQLAIIAENQKKRELELTQFLASQTQIRAQLKTQELTEYMTAEEQKAVIDSSIAAKREQIDIDNNSKLLAIANQFSAEKGFTDFERTQAELAQIQTANAQKEALEQEHAEKLKLINEQIAFNNMSAYDMMATTISSSFSMAGQKLQEFATKAGANFQFVRKQAADALANGTTQAFSKFGQALGRGEDAGKAFLASVADTISQVAVQFGNFFIQTGIGKVALSYGTDATGYAMIAAGIALNALAGSLGGGGGGGSGSGSSESAGASSPTQETTTPVDVVNDVQRQEPQTTVALTIQGDVLDSEESGLRIVEILNSAFDKQGIVIRQGVTA